MFTKLALIREGVVGPGPDHGLMGFVKDVTAVLVLDPPRNELAGLNAPTDAPQQTPVAQHIQHRALFGQAQRMMKGQDI